MPKRYITESDEPGETFAGWFDTETAEAYEPSAGSPAFHERLWQSVGGRWVIQTMPRQFDGREDDWRFVTEEDAQQWRAANRGPEELP